MSTIYLIRHGETKWNLEERFQGITNTELTEKGMQQGKQLAERFKNKKISNIYASPLDRAKITAGYIGEMVNKDVILTDDFKEISFGDWEGLTNTEIENKYSWAKEWFINPGNHQIPNGDDMEFEKKRLKEKLKEIALSNPHTFPNLIVSHAGIIRLAILGAMDLPLSYYWRLTFGNTCVNVLNYEDGRFVLKCLNDTSHLLKK